MICSDLVAFVDEEIPETQAAAFRAHLVDCAKCRGELIVHQKLDALMSSLRDNLSGTDADRAIAITKRGLPWE